MKHKIDRIIINDMKRCDLKKYEEIFNEIWKLGPEDTLQLVLKSKTDDQKDFYELVGNFLLQKKQMEMIARNVY